MQLAKIFGWLLFLLGLATIFYTIFASYQALNGRLLLPEVFSVGSQKTTSSDGISNIISQFEKLFGSQSSSQSGLEILQVLPILNSLPKLLNLLAWSVFAGILIFAGAQIAGLGIKLIKD
jgi:hypothetical protein